MAQLSPRLRVQCKNVLLLALAKIRKQIDSERFLAKHNRRSLEGGWVPPSNIHEALVS